MDKRSAYLNAACAELEEIIKINKSQLDVAKEQLEARGAVTNIPRTEIGKATRLAALETMKHNLATLQAGLKPTDCQYTFQTTNMRILESLAREWQTHSSTELREIVMEEKRKQLVIAEEINKKNKCLYENNKLLEVLLKEKRNLENKREELENQRVTELEEKLARVKRLYGEMKIHLKNTVETYFPDPKIPGYTGMYTFLNELTQRLQNRERDAYIEIPNTVWPYYLETLEKNGIIERHPSDHHKIRIIDFSDGRLGI